MNPEPALTRAIIRAIEIYPGRRIPLHVLQRAAAEVDNTGAASVGWRGRISSALEFIESQGIIVFPRTRFDRSGEPPLPAYVGLPARPKAARRTPVRTVWHAELSWVAELIDKGKLGTADQQLLILVNSWLSKRRGIAAPLRERSLEIFGDEKLLDGRVNGPLFGPGRLTLDLLETYLCWPPVERTGVGTGVWLLIENYTTYHSIASRSLIAGFDGQVIWGSGNSVGTRLDALASSALRPKRLFYFGDIDAGGMRIARTASIRAEELGFPALEPALGLYARLLRHGSERIVDTSRSPDAALLQWSSAWLGHPLGAAAARVLADQKRIVQEHVGTELLINTQSDDWLAVPD